MAPTEPARTQRLFFALWPDDAVRAALAALLARLGPECEGRAMAAANLHVTLAFLGNVPEARVPAFEALADGLTGEPFELRLDRLGYWRHNRIVWAGARAMPAALEALAADMKLALQGVGWAVDERPYAAHVTLLRDARRGPAGHDAIVPPWRVDGFVLVRSEQGAGGVRYTPVRRWPLHRAIGRS